jgi:hypothetical protein
MRSFAIVALQLSLIAVIALPFGAAGWGMAGSVPSGPGSSSARGR